MRVAELEQRRGGTPRITRYGRLPLPPGVVVDGDVVEPETVTTALRELWRTAGLRHREVAVGLASQKVTVREIELPDLPDPELADAVRLQAQDQLPMPVDEAVLDYVVVDRPTVGEDRGNVRVLLVAAERDMVERLLASVTAAKLRPLLVDLDAFALLRSVGTPAVPAQGAELIVDVGAAVSKIAVHRAGSPLFVRMVRFGGEVVTRQLQQVLELSWEEAEEVKLSASRAMTAGADVEGDDERARALQAGVRRVITEVRSSLDFFRAQHEDVEVERVVLCGGASLVPDLAGELATALELPVDQGDPFAAVDARQLNGDGERWEERRFLAVPVGLALGLLA